MKKTILVAMSLDGYISQDRTEASIKWTSKEDKDFFVKKTKQIKYLVMGRKTFDTIGHSLKQRVIFVLTKSKKDELSDLTQEDIQNLDTKVIYVNMELREFLQKISFLDHIAICGGKSIYELFLENDLVDDIYITVEPFLFFSGVRFLDKNIPAKKVNLQSLKILNKNTYLLHICLK